MLHSKLDRLISETDQIHNLFRCFLQTLESHGGKSIHLDRLLADAKSSRKTILKEIAKLVVGDIWKFVENPVDLQLTELDFKISPEDFLEKYPDTRINRGIKYTESSPSSGRPCHYYLCHKSYSIPLREFSNMLAVFSGEHPLEHTGWRELVAYTSRMTASDLFGCKIIAAGSHMEGLPEAFVAAEEDPDEKAPATFGIYPVKQRIFGPDCFFLVRNFN